ncbi:Crp/Fnr family transcriptional regulator [Benzoatithermus flavus]|uniref:Crp/Fnr family transcriptional regulator n=1 Tax=Benzoatithermus flavus TaxID=3108223 RepID=A0ABU8XL50_9PROT
MTTAPFCPPLPEPVRRRVLAEAAPLAVPAGTVLFRPGDACTLYLVLLRGIVRVQLVSATGHEIVLYRVEPGESCVLTTACLLGHDAYAAEGVAETAIEGLGLTPSLFDRLIAESAEFRRFVFAGFGRRLADLMLLVNEVAFRRIDARLADWLLHRYAAGEVAIGSTHQAIAVELGTAREVVSRQLKEFERRGLVALARGRIELHDPAGLRRIARLADRSGRA